MNISRTDAKELIEGYFNTFTDVQNYIDRSIQNAREKGYVETLMGRRIYLPEINARNGMRRQAAERLPINAPMQGSAADIGGYYLPDDTKAAAAMRPSATFNAIVDAI